MNFFQELQIVDFSNLFDRLTAYVEQKLRSVNLKDMDGREPADIVSDLLEKVVCGIRNPEKASCTLAEFLFGCLKSDIDNFFNKKKIYWLSIADETDAPPHQAPGIITELNKAKERTIAELRNIGADEQEIQMFEVWAEGIKKPADVATELNLLPEMVYKIQRRLLSHLRAIHHKLKVLV